jgi:hypothetical protein
MAQKSEKKIDKHKAKVVPAKTVPKTVKDDKKK